MSWKNTRSTIQKHPELIEALNATNCVEMTIPPFGKLYFGPKQPKSASDASSLQNEIRKIKSELSDLRGAGASLQCDKYILNPSCTLSVHLLAVHLVPFLQNQWHQPRYSNNIMFSIETRGITLGAPHAKQTIPPTASSPQTSSS